MKEWLKANWTPIKNVVLVVAAYVFVIKYPLTDGQRQDFTTILFVAGLGAAAGQGFRAPRREDDPK